MKIRKFRKKPVIIDAIQWTGKNTKEVESFIGKTLKKQLSVMRKGEIVSLYIDTLEGGHVASISDWIIKGIKGEFYPCKPDIFEQTYEKVEGDI